MAGTKAAALDDWAARSSRAFVRFDYGGCGESGGAFEDQSLDDWLGDALAVIDATDGPLLLVGSSMGGWIMLLAALARPDRIAGLVGIAAAPDFTDWGFSQDQKLALLRDGRIEEASDYGPPLVTTRGFWQSGEAHRLLDGPIAIDCPVRVLHGQRDVDAPWEQSLRLTAALRSADVQTILIKDGDHRLSRPRDIALLIDTIESLPEL
ncbi:MAG: alpha/beta fold hydrolase [Sphingomonadaceae bacterium]|nr:alpha/beta fold hydrolase [Sphingomonadaceae bacterium]